MTLKKHKLIADVSDQVNIVSSGEAACEERGSSILTSLAGHWLSDEWNVNEFK
jgi:hypothetical protein